MINRIAVAAILALCAGRAGFAQGPARLEAVDMQADLIMIRTDRPVRHRTFSINGPPRLVIDLQDTENDPTVKDGTGSGRWLKQYRAGQFSRAPFVARVVLELTGPVANRITESGRVLTVQLGDPAAAGSIKTASAVAPAAAAVLPPDAPRRTFPMRPADDFLEDALTLSFMQMILLGAACLLAGGLVLRLMWTGLQDWRESRRFGANGCDLSMENSAEMIAGLQENVNALARRISILEKKVAQAGAAVPSQAAGAASGKMDEELAALKTVVKSIVKALQLPARSI